MKIGIDFCIIDNPFNTSDKSNLLVFITKEGLEYLEDKTVETDGYRKAVSELKKLGFLETDNFRFEFIQNDDLNYEPEENMIISTLENIGATYSDKLEDNIYQDFSNLKDNIDLDLINSLIKEAETVSYDSSIDKAFNDLHNYKDPITEDLEDVYEIDLPKIKEIIELNLFIFIDMFFKEGEDFVADISGDFTRNQKNLPSGVFRSMVKIFKDNFKRVNYNKNPDVIELISTKTKGEILKEISFLYDVSIEVVKAQKFNETKFLIENEPKYYNILQIKDHIGNLEECIYFEVSVKDYFKLISKSKSIGIQKESKQDKETIYVDEVVDEALFFIETIKSDIKSCAKNEEFEEALVLKEISNSLDKKVDNFKKQFKDKEKMSIEDFHSKLGSEI